MSAVYSDGPAPHKAPAAASPWSMPRADHHPLPPYSKSPRRAIQLGLRGDWQLDLATGAAIVDVTDITDFVEATRVSKRDQLATLLVPMERVYVQRAAWLTRQHKPHVRVSAAADQLCTRVGRGSSLSATLCVGRHEHRLGTRGGSRCLRHTAKAASR